MLVVAVAVAVDVVWVLCSAVLGFPAALETIFQTVAAVTLAMVFVIQHRQSRQQVATKRKLDEILRALPHADNALIALEEASDDALAAAHSTHQDLRRGAVADPVPPTRARPGRRASQ